jgi:hypothetical protein
MKKLNLVNYFDYHNKIYFSQLNNTKKFLKSKTNKYERKMIDNNWFDNN